MDDRHLQRFHRCLLGFGERAAAGRVGRPAAEEALAPPDNCIREMDNGANSLEEIWQIHSDVIVNKNSFKTKS